MRRPRIIVEGLVLAAIAAVVLHTFYGQWQTVASGSMAGTLDGPHYRIACHDCEYEFSCDAGSPAPEKATCPLCGYVAKELGDVVAGTELLVDRSAFQLRRPKRWEVVVFRSPDDDGAPTVKRVVGLPGETIDLRGGDVFIDGQIARKTLDEQRAVGVLVDDTAFPPGRITRATARWTPGEGSAWRGGGGKFIYSSNPAANGPATSPAVDWIEYHHWRRVTKPSNATDDSPVRDDDVYNGDTSRRLNDVCDLRLVAQLQAEGDGRLVFRIHDGWQWFEIAADPVAGRLELSRDGVSLQTAQVTAPMLARPSSVEVSVIDCRVLVAVNDAVLLDYAYEPGAGERRATSRPLSIGVQGLSVQIERLQVFRDVYYTDASRPTTTGNRAGPLPCRLGPDDYFVLGDNSPVSDDSRTWGVPALPAASLIGKPIGVH